MLSKFFSFLLFPLARPTPFWHFCYHLLSSFLLLLSFRSRSARYVFCFKPNLVFHLWGLILLSDSSSSESILKCFRLTAHASAFHKVRTWIQWWIQTWFCQFFCDPCNPEVSLARAKNSLVWRHLIHLTTYTKELRYHWQRSDRAWRRRLYLHLLLVAVSN